MLDMSMILDIGESVAIRWVLWAWTEWSRYAGEVKIGKR